MRNAVWLRAGFPPFQRLGLLATATDVDRSFGVRVDGKAVFRVRGNDSVIANVLKGKVVEIRGMSVRERLQIGEERKATTTFATFSGGVARYLAQGYVMPGSGHGRLDSLELPLYRTGIPEGVIGVKVHADDGAGLPGAVLATSTTTLDVALLSTTQWAWYPFAFAAPITLNRNMTYHISIDISGLTTHTLAKYVRWIGTDQEGSGALPSYSTDYINWTATTAVVVKTRLNGLWTDYPEIVAPWIGWIERPQYDASNGMVTVDCIDVAGMMGKRHSGLKSTRSGCAGLIARELLFQANARNGFGLQWDTTSEAGTPISTIDVSGSSLLDALNQLADYTGDEWWIRILVAHDNLELYLHWGRRQGFDLSQTVYLREGREVSAFAYSQDTIEETESVMVVGSGGTVEDRPTVVRATTGAERVNLAGAVVQQASETYKRSAAIVPALATERVLVAPLESDIKVLGELARNDLEQSPDTVETLAITVNERANWLDLAVGNTVRLRANTPWGALDRAVRIMESQPGDGELDLIVQVLDG
ncbi:MAG: hypothetical protein MUO35_03785 [Anaerolineales bacterium]|nr:hypothetical protein [Anaerolineales bacterium]